MAFRTVSPAMIFFVALAAFGLAPSQAEAEADIVIGAGSSAKVHHNVARAMCRQIQKTVIGVSCEALRIEGGDAAEPGAVLNNLRNAALELGIVPADWQYHATQGTGPFKFTGKIDNARALFSLHAQPFTLVARRDAGINSLDDLAGKRINIGTPGSPQRVMMNMLMAAKKWTTKSFGFVDELSENEQSLALCHNRVQAVVSTSAHPSPAIAQAIKLCDAKIVPVTGDAVGKLIADNRFLSSTAVPAGLYDGHVKAAKTFGVAVTVMTSEDMEEDLIYTVVKTVFENLGRFKRLHPSLAILLPGRMMTDGLSAPLHKGAVRYYREKNMM